MIEIYYMKLEGDCSYEQSLAFSRFLPKERRERITGVHNREVVKKRIYAGVFLQYVLSKATGIPIERLSYQYGPQGKPELVSGPVCFNLSHSGDYVVLAVGERPVGIDIEYKRKNALSVAKRCFTEAEYKRILEAGNGEEQELCFLRYWTEKEAYIKYTGEGLRTPLRSFEIIELDTVLSHTMGENAWFYTMWLGDSPYCVSVCSKEYAAVSSISKKEIRLSEIRDEMIG